MKFDIITSTNLKPMPTKDEMSVAEVLANFFQSNIKFVARGVSHTPDIYVTRFRQYWEIKNIRGNGPRTIANVLREAQHQSENVAISLSRTNMNTQQAMGRIRKYLREGNTRVKRIIVIAKNKKVLVIK